MSVGLYMDEHVHSEISNQLQSLGVDVLTIQADQRRGSHDLDVLDRATELGRVLLTHDEDFLREASIRQKSGVEFSGAIYGHPLCVTIGQCVADLEVLCKAGDTADFLNQVYFLPL